MQYLEEDMEECHASERFVDSPHHFPSSWTENNAKRLAVLSCYTSMSKSHTNRKSTTTALQDPHVIVYRFVFQTVLGLALEFTRLLTVPPQRACQKPQNKGSGNPREPASGLNAGGRSSNNGYCTCNLDSYISGHKEFS